MNKTLTPNDVRELTGTGGEFFRIGFNKRPKPLGKRALAAGQVQPTKGEYREMTCRFGVQKDLSDGPKGGKKAYDFDEKNVLGVWIPEQDRREDGKDKGYRVVPCENVTVLKAHGKVWSVEDGVLVEQDQ
jgi:hypothetical protein